MSVRRWALTRAASWIRWLGIRRTRELSVEGVLAAARTTMRRCRYCVIATQERGEIYARVVQPYHPDREFRVWMGTSSFSRKVLQLEREPRATLLYEDDRRAAAVSLMGSVTVVRDARRFMPLWHAFWPDGLADPTFVNLLFEPHRIEVWDASRGITPAPYGLVSAQAVRDGQEWRLRDSASTTDPQ